MTAPRRRTEETEAGPQRPALVSLVSVARSRALRAPTRAHGRGLGLTVVAGVAPLLGHGALWPAGCCPLPARSPASSPFKLVPTPSCMALLGPQGRGAIGGGRGEVGRANEFPGLDSCRDWGERRSPTPAGLQSRPREPQGCPTPALGGGAAPFAWFPLPPPCIIIIFCLFICGDGVWQTCSAAGGSASAPSRAAPGDAGWKELAYLPGAFATPLQATCKVIGPKDGDEGREGRSPTPLSPA